MLRNPKDQLVSMYNFTRQFPAANTNEPFKSLLFSGWDKYFEHVVSGKVFFNKIALHGAPAWYKTG